MSDLSIIVTLVLVPFKGEGVAYGVTANGQPVALKGDNVRLITLCGALGDHIARGVPLVISAAVWDVAIDDDVAS